MGRLLRSFLIGLILFTSSNSWASSKGSDDRYFIVDIDQIGHNALEQLKNLKSVAWWVEADDKLLLFGSKSILPHSLKGSSWKMLSNSPKTELLYLAENYHESLEPYIEGVKIIAGGRMAVFQMKSPLKSFSMYRNNFAVGPHNHLKWRFMERNIILARQSENDLPIKDQISFSKSTDQRVSEVNPERWFKDVEKLSTWNRYSHNDSLIPARDWFVSQFKSLGEYAVETSEFSLNKKGDISWNVILTIKGSKRPDDWYVVGGHYDSISEDTSSSAPGAEDNASGAAAVLEMARSFAKNPPEATIKFMVFSGEELGLIGSEAEVEKMLNRGEKTKLKEVMIMDMIGYSRDQKLDVLLETNKRGAYMFETYKQAAQKYTTLRVSTSTNPFGSDHMPFIDNGLSALLVIENDWNSYPSYHKTSDLPEKISIDMGSETIKMNVATLSNWVGP